MIMVFLYSIIILKITYTHPTSSTLIDNNCDLKMSNLKMSFLSTFLLNLNFYGIFCSY